MLKYAVPKFPAANVQTAVAFYEEKLGFQKLFDYGDYAGVKRDAFELHLWECPDSYLAENSACRVNVTDIEALYAEYQAAGVIHPHGALETKPWGLKEFVILDLDGNGIFFFE
jgi:uncharacterized glyoxalase superfamily protein PhnB